MLFASCSCMLSLNHMVERESLNDIFKSLADPTRRDILSRVLNRELTISELAKSYEMSFAATAKHVSVLERAELVHKVRQGKEQLVSINAHKLNMANEYFQDYAKLWNGRFDQLETALKKGGNDGK